MSRHHRTTTIIYVAVICFIGLAARSSVAAKDDSGLFIEHAYLATYPEADCTKIHIYVKNTGRFPMFLDGIWYNDTWLDLDVEKWVVEPGKKSTGGHGLEHAKSGIRRKTRGIFQWHRALPNPVEPGRVTDVCVSLWGIHKQARIRVKVRAGGMLEWQAKEQAKTLRLSHIAFDPNNPNKLYVYVENKTKQDIAIDHLRVNTEIVQEMKTIPAGQKVEAGKKTCIIIHPKKKLPWGSYCGVSVIGKDSEQVTAVVRVINYFPIGSWSVDTRPEMFFDSIDLRKPMPNLTKKTSATDPLNTLTRPTSATNERPYQAYYDGRDPTCDSCGWQVTQCRIIRTMAHLSQSDPIAPYYTHICHTTAQAYAHFGELPDLALVNPYTILFRPEKPSASARRVQMARIWSDPRPIVSIPEAFVQGEASRDLTPDEVSFAMWSEVAEGSKGVRYFTRGGGERTRGYSQIPGIEARMVHDNINLQLIKNFLRIGDTFTLASTTSDQLTCRSILCGSKGAVLILLNTQYNRTKRTPWEWRRLNNVEVRVNVPDGQVIRQILAVNQGLKETEFRKSGNTVAFSIANVELVRVFLIEFLPNEMNKNQQVRKNGRLPLPSVRPREAATITPDALVRRLHTYLKHVVQVVSPLLDPRRVNADSDIRDIGLRIGAMRVELLRDLIKSVPDRNSDQSAFVLQATKSYIGMGEYEKAERLYLSALDRLTSEQRVKITNALASYCLKHGKYDMACWLYEVCLNLSLEKDMVPAIIGKLIEVHEKHRHDYGSAAQLVRKRLTHFENDPVRLATETVRLATETVRLAVLLMEDDRPAEAIAMVCSVDRSQCAGQPVDYVLGMCHFRLGACREAEKYLRKAVTSCDCHAAAAQYMLAKVLLAENRNSEAAKELDKLVRAFPQSQYASLAANLSTQLSKRTKKNRPSKQ